MSMSRLVNNNVRGSQGRTSIRLEPEFWCALDEICAAEGVKRNELVRRIERSAPDGCPRTSALRVYILEYYRGNRRQGVLRDDD